MRFTVILLALLLLTNSVFARVPTVAVVPEDQKLPDSALQLTALLRVTGLTCHGNDGKPLYPLYQLFTQNNASLLKSYQTQMLANYQQKGARNPESSLHARETEIENIQSLTAAKVGMQSFCGQNVPKLQSASVASATQVERMIEDFAKTKDGAR
jgi:hypothetical protein